MKKQEELYSCSQQDRSAMAETDIKMVPIADLHDFEGHPFKVENDMALFELMQSIEKEGVIVPALARPKASGGYELIAGHRRKAACKWAGLDVMPVVIRELDDNQAVIVMMDSNLQREHLKPSEKQLVSHLILGLYNSRLQKKYNHMNSYPLFQTQDVLYLTIHKIKLHA